jgi:hypothetical protein
VRERFGVELVPEPVLVGHEWRAVAARGRDAAGAQPSR